MRVNEIFYSLLGEGIHVGIPTVFVRLQGCNLCCNYCDTAYALRPADGEEMTLLQVKERVYSFAPSPRWLLITGGEPLLQSVAVKELVFHLQTARRLVEIETNGSFDPPSWFGFVDCWSVDVKCPSSGPSYGSFRLRWLGRLRKQDQLKFVVGTRADLAFVRGFLNNSRIRAHILVSPVAGLLMDKRAGLIDEYWFQSWLQEVAEFCKEHNVRLSLQTHKLVWGNRKGV